MRGEFQHGLETALTPPISRFAGEGDRLFAPQCDHVFSKLTLRIDAVALTVLLANPREGSREGRTWHG